MSSSSTRFGLPLEAPSTQTVLPVVEKTPSTAIIHGYFPIASTTFDGTETTFQVQAGPGGTVAIESVTLPDSIDDGSGYGVKQYMAVTYEYLQAALRPWLGFTQFFNTDETNYRSAWSVPTNTRTHHFNLGNLLRSLVVNMAAVPAATPSTPVPPPGEDGSLRWVVSVDISSAGQQCMFFDFNWWNLFKAQPPVGAVSNTVIPLTISTKSNPPGNYFRAAILQQQTVVPGGATVFDTVRIVRITDQEIPPDDYEFEFTIAWVNAGVQTTTDVSLTLTVA